MRVSAAVVAGVFAAGLVAVGGGGSVAAPTVPTVSTVSTAPTTRCTDTTGVPYATGLPPLPCLPSPNGTTRWTDDGALYLPDGPAASILGDRRVARSFVLVCGNQPGSAVCPAGLTGPLPPRQTNATTVVQRVFFQSPRGADTQFGVLALFPVDLQTDEGRLQGTVVLAQATVDGVAAPLAATQSAANPLYPEGTVVPGFEQYGPNPGPGTAQVFGDLAGTGPGTATLAGATLDGAPVDTGSCAAGGTLAVSARGGWAVGDPVPGGSAEYRPFAPPSYLHATLSGVRAYRCDGVDPAVKAEVLAFARLAAAMPIQFTAATDLTPFGCLTGSTSGCITRHPAVVDPARVPVHQ